jgi:pimeloyl-ACP methyl ester carboxylesterase
MNRHPLKLTRLMFFARRAPIDRTPVEVGLTTYEDVSFKAGDGVGIKGWFIPNGKEGLGPAIVFVHGWMWNRLGNVAGLVPVDDRDVDFLPAARALHDAGFHVLMYDVRKHGESESGRGPITFGPLEKRDFIGAVNYLRSRPDVDGQRIGSLGVSMGGTIALYGAPDCQPIKAILAIQPAKVTTFNTNFCRLEFGPAGPIVMMPPIELVYRAWRVTPPSKQDPGAGAELLDGTIVKYVQGTGDRYGTMEDVEDFHRRTPNVDGPVVKFPSTGRYDGYRYVSECRDEIADFFTRHV